MRDPKRLPEMLQLLALVWAANPDLRLTQLVNNAAFAGGWKDNDTFHCEDDVTMAGLVQLAQGDVTGRKG